MAKHRRSKNERKKNNKPKEEHKTRKERKTKQERNIKAKANKLDEKTMEKIEEYKALNRSKNFYFGMAMIFGLILVAAILGYKLGSMHSLNVNLPRANINKEEPMLKFFIVSYCPFGQRFALQTIPEINKKTKNWQVYFITAKQNGKYISMHGDKEAQENLREGCIRDIYGKEKWLDYVLCFYQGNKQPEDCMKEKNIDINVINDCMSKNTALDKDIEEAQKYQAYASPTTVVVYENRSMKLEGLMPAANILPALKSIKKGYEKVKAYFITTKKCTDNLCLSFDSLKEWFRNKLFVDLKGNIIYYEDNPEIVKELNLSMVPALYFDEKDVENAAFFNNIRRYFKHINGKYVSEFGPFLVNTNKTRATIDVYIMSQCPYGNAAIKNLEELKKVMPELKINVHYIYGMNNGNITSMHGAQEILEDLRQICIREKYPAEYWNYLVCMADNYRDAANQWRNCAENASINATIISNCVSSGEVYNYVNEDYNLTQSKGIGSSPTFIIDNELLITGLMPVDKLQKIICSLEDLQGCNATVQSTAQVTGGSC